MRTGVFTEVVVTVEITVVVTVTVLPLPQPAASTRSAARGSSLRISAERTDGPPLESEWMDRNGIEAEGLVRQFKDVRAVDGIDLTVAPGEIYGFLGPNGAGKSTTVHMLTTLLPPTSGTARVAGFDIVKQGPEVRRAIGAALQEAALDPLLSGRDHMRLQTALHGIPRQERARRGDELLERVGLTLAADRRVRTYSGGMKRRLDLALALVHRPRLLFLDEPTTGLDPQSRNALWREVGRLAKEEGVTVFLTTQYLEEADVLADRVGIIDQGRIVAEGTPAALKAEIGRPTVEVIPADPEQRVRLAEILRRFGELVQLSPDSVAVRCEHDEYDLVEIVRALDAEDLHAAHLQLHAPSLDDVFLEKTGRTLEGAAAEAEAEAEPAPA
jgi:ABC-2 type transport system ATP-binding protein